MKGTVLLLFLFLVHSQKVIVDDDGEESEKTSLEIVSKEISDSRISEGVFSFYSLTWL
jgi:hypothetical protein